MVKEIKKHLFIVCHPHCGSTLLSEIIKTSKNVSGFRFEGQFVKPVKHILFTKDRWDPNRVVDWDQVKTKWYKVWDTSKPVLLDKTPPNILQTSQISEVFENSHFVGIIRSPYFFVEGGMRRFKTNPDILMDIWIKTARKVLTLIGGENFLFFRYEDLTKNPVNIKSKLVSFIGELEDIDIGKQYKIFARTEKINDLNKKYFPRINQNIINKVNSNLASSGLDISQFGYTVVKSPDKIKNYLITDANFT